MGYQSGLELFGQLVGKRPATILVIRMLSNSSFTSKYSHINEARREKDLSARLANRRAQDSSATQTWCVYWTYAKRIVCGETVDD